MSGWQKCEELRSFTDSRCVFRGFDLTDGSISASVNCAGFDNALAKAELSEFGLLAGHARAVKVQRLLRAEYAKIAETLLHQHD